MDCSSRTSEEPAGVPHFRIPLNLPHAGRVARRIVLLLPTAARTPGPAADEARRLAKELEDYLAPCYDLGENPTGPTAAVIQARAAELGRGLVTAIEKGALGSDRIGQCVRNLFECLELGVEGTLISLRAGEDPKSPQRPT